MNEQILHRAISGEAIVPSSGFTQSVMDAVRAEASGPRPIQFPWKRAIPGIAAVICGVGALAVSWTTELLSPGLATGSWDVWSGILTAMNRYGAGWAVMALLVSAISGKVCMRLTRAGS